MNRSVVEVQFSLFIFFLFLDFDNYFFLRESAVDPIVRNVHTRGPRVRKR